jgi:hypothetical protein
MTNPFEVLRLGPDASEQEIVGQAERLCQRATDDAALGAIRQAATALTANPLDRLLHSLLTHPRPAGAAPALDRLAAAFGRAPPRTEEQGTRDVSQAGKPDLRLGVPEFLRLLLTATAEELGVPPGTFEPVSDTDDEDEVNRQFAEALWQSLLFDPRA